MDDDGYTGPGTLELDGTELDVSVILRGHFEPIDGRYHWYGRIGTDPRIGELLGGHNRPAVLRTPDGEAGGMLSDPDTWGRYRITGTSRPPFAIAPALDDPAPGDPALGDPAPGDPALDSSGAGA